MKVYLDVIFLENIVIDVILLKELSYIARKNFYIKKAILASFIGALYIVIMLYFKIEELSYASFKVLLAFVIIYIHFNPKTIPEYLKLVALFILVSVINIGALYFIKNLFNIKSVSLLGEILIYTIGLILSKLLMKSMWKLYKSEINKKDLRFDVKIKIGKKEFYHKAFLDTGNSVYSYKENVPIVFARDIGELAEIKKREDIKRCLVETVTLSNKTEKEAYIIESMEISKDKNLYITKAGIVFENIKIKDYDMILNYILYTDVIGGIKI